MSADPVTKPLRLADASFDDAAIADVGTVLASGVLTNGPRTAEFESLVAELTGVRHAVAVSSGTTALHVVLAALGLGRGDDVAVADFTHPATANAVVAVGAQPLLVDVREDTYAIDAGALREALTPQTRAVIAVDPFGLPADYATIEAVLADRPDVVLVADAACSLGGSFHGRPCGSIGRAATFSFHPRKVITTAEGGMVTTDDGDLAHRMRRLRNHGGEPSGAAFRFVEPAFNFRLSEVHATLGVHAARRLRDVVDRRRALAARLTAALTGVPGVVPQRIPDGSASTFQSFVVRVAEGIDRDTIVAGLRARGVESTIGTYALHAEPAFSKLCGTAPGDLPRSYGLARRTLALPLHQALGDDDVDRVADELVRVLPSGG